MSVVPPPPSADPAAADEADEAVAAGATALAAEVDTHGPLDLATVAAPRRRRRRRPSDRPARPAPAHRPLRRRLVSPLAAATAVDIVLAVGDRLPAVDGLAYFETGRNLLGGEGYTRAGAPELHFPPVVPVCLRLLELVTGSEMAALGTWNVLTSVAVVAALVGLAHRLWHDDDITVAAAWLGGTMAGLGPLFFRHGSGSEGATLALLLGALLLTLRGLDERSDVRVPVRAAWLAGSGLLVGLAYLTRPEALLPGAVVGFAAVLWTWHHARRPAVPHRGAPTGSLDAVPGARGSTALLLWCRRGMPVVAAFGLGAAILVAPYAVYLHANTGKWSLTAKSQDVSIEAWRAVAEGDRRVRDQYVYALNPDGTLGAETQSLTALAAEDPAGWASIVGVNARELAEDYVSPFWRYGLAWQLLPAPLVALALFELWKLRRHRATQLLAGVAVVPLLTCLAFFTLPRYLALPTAVLTLYAARCLVRARRALPRPAAVSLVAVVALLVAMSSLTEARSFLPGGNTADPLDHQQAAHWIEANTPPGARVMTRSFHVQAYARRPIVALPVADYASTLHFARQMGVSYVVVDSRSALYWSVAQEEPSPRGLRLVAVLGRSTYPIRVYQLDPLPPPSDRAPLPLGYVGD